MPFLHPLGLLALLAVPAVLGLHLFRRRYRRRTVSALFLWTDAREVPRAGRHRERLLRSPSLWLELLAALLLALVVAGPSGCDPRRAEHLVCVLDDSASMSAADDAGETARQRAIDALDARLDALGSRGRVTLVVSGPRPRLLAGPGALAAEAHAALEDYRPRAGRHDLAPAVSLALKVAGGGSVLVLTDRFEPEVHPDEVELEAVGTPLPNAAVARARRTPHPDGDGRERVALTLAHSGSPTASATVVLAAEGTELARREVRLATGEPQELAFALPRSDAVIEARLVAGGGALALDDTAWLAPPPPRTVALATTLGDEDLRALGLGGDEPLARWRALLSDAVVVEPALAHAVLGRSETARVSFDVDAGDGPRREWLGPFLVEKRHPLLSGVTLDGVIWSAGEERALPGTPLVSAGSVPLVTEELGGGARRFHVNLDPRRSTLARSPDWPILLANLAALARAELPGPERTNLVVGDALVHRSRSEGRWRLTGPDTDRELAGRETLVVEDLDRPGVYQLARESSGPPEGARFALSFADAAESDLTDASSGHRPSPAARATLEAGLPPLVQLLSAVLLGVLVLDWWILGREGRPAPRP